MRYIPPMLRFPHPICQRSLQGKNCSHGYSWFYQTMFSSCWLQYVCKESTSRQSGSAACHRSTGTPGSYWSHPFLRGTGTACHSLVQSPCCHPEVSCCHRRLHWGRPTAWEQSPQHSPPACTTAWSSSPRWTGFARIFRCRVHILLAYIYQ